MRAAALASIGSIIVCMAASPAFGQDTAAVVLDIPTPEQGVIRVHFGPPVGIRPAPREARAAATSESRTIQRRSETRSIPSLLSDPSTQYWMDWINDRPALIFLSDTPGAVPDTVFLADQFVEEPEEGIAAPPLRGVAVPDELARARVTLPERDIVERMLLDEGLFRSVTVQFEFDRSSLLPIADPTLDAIVDVMRRHPELEIEVGGHTDDVGSAAYNRTLSQERAEAVRLDMIQRGVDPDRITAVGYGEEQPLLPNQNPTHRALNRRVEFRITGRADVSSPPDDDATLLDVLQQSLREALRESLPQGRQ